MVSTTAIHILSIEQISGPPPPPLPDKKFIIGCQLEKCQPRVNPKWRNANMLQTTIGTVSTQTVDLTEDGNRDIEEETEELLLLLKAG